jgi:4-amino-4-deoxy-L-arabinose transferase-like glycosyltransferase
LLIEPSAKLSSVFGLQRVNLRFTATVAVAELALLQIVVWTLVPLLMHYSPPLDVVEGYLWAHEWVLSTYKHPALPSWVLEGARLLTGAVDWPPYLVSQLFVVTTFWLVFRLGKDLMDEQSAAVGTLLLVGIAGFSWRSIEFNHNVAQMPFFVATVWSIWRATVERSAFWWVAAGICAALGFYAKLSMAILLVPAVLWCLVDREARKSFATPGPWVAVIVFAILVLPLAAWLASTELGPLHYLAGRASIGGAKRVDYLGAKFVAGQAASAAPLLLLIVLSGLITLGRSTHARATAMASPAIPLRRLRFLMFVALGPLLLALGFAVFFNARLRTEWGVPMMCPMGLLLVALFSRRVDERTLRVVTIGANIVLVCSALLYCLSLLFPLHSSAAPSRVNWPQADIAQGMREIWWRNTGRPLRIVAGTTWIAGIVALDAKDRPSFLPRGDYNLAPHIDERRIEQEGILVVWEEGRRHMPEFLRRLVGDRPVGREKFSWPRPGKNAELTIAYVIMPPAK